MGKSIFDTTFLTYKLSNPIVNGQDQNKFSRPNNTFTDIFVNKFMYKFLILLLFIHFFFFFFFTGPVLIAVILLKQLSCVNIHYK